MTASKRMCMVVAVLLLLVILMVVLVRKTTPRLLGGPLLRTTTTDDYCGFNGPHYAPNVVQTTADTAKEGKFIRDFFAGAVKLLTPKLSAVTMTKPGCTPSTLDNINLCISQSFLSASVKFNSINGLLSNLFIGPLKQIQSFPAASNVSPSVSSVQNVYMILPIGIKVDISMDLDLGVPPPPPLQQKYTNTIITVYACFSIFLEMSTVCSSLTQTTAKQVKVNAVQFPPVSIDIHDSVLSAATDLITYFGNISLQTIIGDQLNKQLNEDLIPLIIDGINSQLPYNLPLPICFKIPSNTLTAKNGVEYTGLFGYRPTYPDPDRSQEDWMKCTVGCAQAGIGKAQDCLDACVDIVDASPLSNNGDCANKATAGYFTINDRAAATHGVAPNGPLWAKTCNITALDNQTLVPDSTSGYIWYQTVNKFLPAMLDILPAAQGTIGARGATLGQDISHTDINDCRYACTQDPNCKAISYALYTDPVNGYHDGDCFESSGPLILDNNFETYTPVSQ